MKGKIKNLHEKGYGFIKPEDGGKDVFFHATKVTNADFTSLRPGDTVFYETEETDKGIQAYEVVLE